jgi:hypothetical protein
LVEHWNGVGWSTEQAPAGGTLTASQCPSAYGCSAGGDLDGIACVSATTCTAVGSFTNLDGTQQTLTERWNGVTWTVQGMPPA